MLKLTSFGHAGSNNPQELQNLIQAGKGFEVHAANIPTSAHEVIDQGQQTVSNIAKEGAELPQTIAVSVPSIASSVSHNWVSHAIKVTYPVSEALPTLEGWL